MSPMSSTPNPRLQAALAHARPSRRVRSAEGEHVFLAYRGTHTKKRAGTQGPGLDARCCGGLAVPVGAMPRTAHVCAWQAGCGRDQVPFAGLPPWLLEQLI